jgi:hypothetical protein
MKTNSDLVLLGIGLLLAAVVLSRSPRCNRGCQTLAEHLAKHGIDDILGGLLA